MSVLVSQRFLCCAYDLGLRLSSSSCCGILHPAMAAAIGVWLFLGCWALLMNPALADENSDLLTSINQYRVQQNLSALTLNTGAACIAQQVANQYKGTVCSNTTGADTVSGQEPQLSTTVLSNCKLQIDNVKDGYIAPDCIPTGSASASATQVAYANITASPTYQGELNNSKYVSAGVGSVDSAWFVLVLATNTSTGDFVSQNLDPSGAFIASTRFAITAILAYVTSSLIVS